MLDLVRNTEDRFSHDVAHIVFHFRQTELSTLADSLVNPNARQQRQQPTVATSVNHSLSTSNVNQSKLAKLRDHLYRRHVPVVKSTKPGRDILLLYYSLGVFIHQPTHPHGEGATIKRISPSLKTPAERNHSVSTWDFVGKIDRPRIPVFNHHKIIQVTRTPTVNLPRNCSGIKVFCGRI